MSTTATVVLCLLVAALLVAAMTKKKKTLIGGWLVRGKNGAMFLQITPAKRGKRRKK